MSLIQLITEDGLFDIVGQPSQGGYDVIAREIHPNNSNIIYEEQPQEYLRKGIYETIDFSARVDHCLDRAGIFTLGDLISKTPSDLMNIRAFGIKCLREVTDELSKIGLSLVDSPNRKKPAALVWKDSMERKTKSSNFRRCRYKTEDS